MTSVLQILTSQRPGHRGPGAVRNLVQAGLFNQRGAGLRVLHRRLRQRAQGEIAAPGLSDRRILRQANQRGDTHSIRHPGQGQRGIRIPSGGGLLDHANNALIAVFL